MPYDITMPQLGLTMERGTVVEWLVEAGSHVTPGQEILQVETDKATVAVEAHQEGTIARILVAAGEEVPVGAVLALAVAPGEEVPVGTLPADGQPAPLPQPSPPAAAGDGSRGVSWKARHLARQAGLDLAYLAGSGPGGRVVAGDVARALDQGRGVATPSAKEVESGTPPPETRATPVAANLAAALGLDLAQVAGSGPQGQVGQADVLAAAAGLIRGGADSALVAAHPRATSPESRGAVPQVAATTPLKGVRRVVSAGMAASAQATARVTLLREVDAGELVRLRERLAGRGQNLSYNDLFIRICALALKEHPAANARLGDGQIEHLDRVNVGLAVDTERGLLVPVVRDADRLSLAAIAAERARLVDAARAGHIGPDDLSGGTFTITNLGMFGVEAFTPIINLPESCILGLGKIVRKPVAWAGGGQDEAVVVRPTLALSLAFDHRVLDGAPAARFLDQIARLVEEPLLLLMAE